MDNSKIHEALMAVQSELKAPKRQMNKFGGYKYRSCENILEAVKPILKAHSLVLLLSDKPVIVDSWHYIEATATVESQDGATYTVTAYAREPEYKKGMDDSQITGTASSYARKCALNGLFCIDDTKDADTDEYRKQTTSRVNEPDQKRTEAIPPCACCGKQLQPALYNNRTHTPLEIKRITEKKFGRVLCWDCAQKQPKEG